MASKIAKFSADAMTAEFKKRPVLGVLGMADNIGTQKLLDFLVKETLPLDFVIFWKPSFSMNLRRVRRKLKNAGFGPAIQRIHYALFNNSTKRAADTVDGSKSYREYFVSQYNSAACRQILKQETPDILLLSTDAIIGRSILRIPRMAVLNAHPGWLPMYRGLGGQLYQMEAGWLPAVTIHCADEGVDTGPIIMREQLDVDTLQGLDGIAEEVARHGHRLLSRVIRMFEDDDVTYIDTFGEPNRMTRGMPARRRKKLEANLSSGRLTLRRFTAASECRIKKPWP